MRGKPRIWYDCTAKNEGGAIYTSSAATNAFTITNEGGSISFTFTPDSGYWLHEINVNGTYVGSGYVSRNYKIPSVTKRTVVSFGFSSSTSSPKTADPNQDILTWGIAEIVSLIGMTTITWYLFRRKEY